MENLYNLHKLAEQEAIADQNLSEKKYVCINMFSALNEELTYTFKKGDGRRLNKEGILRVYNINRPIEIPVTKLLGKWKNNYAGIKVVVIDGEWQVDKEQFEHILKETKNYPFLKTVFGKVKKSVLKYRTPPNISDSFWNRSMDKDNQLNNA